MQVQNVPGHSTELPGNRARPTGLGRFINERIRLETPMLETKLEVEKNGSTKYHCWGNICRTGFGSGK